ncbi:unnamed protein product [Discula destructiva]
MSSTRRRNAGGSAVTTAGKIAPVSTILEAPSFTTCSTTSSPLPSRRAALLPSRLLAFDELPEWYQDAGNEFIRSGYRPVSGSAAASITSNLRGVHNETVNVYSHLVPCIGFVVGGWGLSQYLYSHYPRITTLETTIFGFFIVAAAGCLGISSTYHTMLNHSHAWETTCLRLDFVGIILLTIGDFVSGVYMVFYCEPGERAIYWAMILMLGALTVLALVNPNFQGRRWRRFRISCFVGTAMSGFAPLAHGVYLSGWAQMTKQSGMPYYLLEGVFLCVGVLFYATRFPECVRPGKFDLYGSSHQIFHFFVVLATVAHFVGILEAFDYNYHNRTCASPPT